MQEAPDFPLALGPRAFGGSLGGGPGATVSSFGPLGRFWKSPTFRLFEWVRPSGFVDAARKGPIEPNSKSLSRGDPLDRAEKSGDPTTLFRGQEVKKGSARPPNRYTLKWEAGRPPYGDERSHGLETRHAPPSWAPHSGPRVWGPWRLLKHFMCGCASRQNQACFRVSPIEFNGRQRDIWKMRKNTFRGPRSGLFRHIAPGLLTQLCVRFGPPGNFWKNVPLSGYLNGFGLAVSWTRLGRVRLSRIRNLCLKGTPSTGRKSLVTLRPSLGVKRSEKWRAHVRIFLEYFCFIFFKGLPEHWVLWPFSMWQVRAPRSSIRSP